MTAPAWARSLVAAVCADSGIAQPRLSWRRRSGDHSTGVTRRSDGIVAVRAGADELDQRLTLGVGRRPSVDGWAPGVVAQPPSVRESRELLARCHAVSLADRARPDQALAGSGTPS